MIRYDQTFNRTAGYLAIEPDKSKEGERTDTPREALKDPHRKTLLHLIFWALYTWDGREMMRNNKLNPETGQIPDGGAALKAKFAEFGVTDAALVQAILDAHIAAEKWVLAYKANKPGDLDLHEKVYSQNMSFITWCLWEDAKAHEFSMGW
jgi:hypothetical protein